jgi:hypothetical protein
VNPGIDGVCSASQRHMSGRVIKGGFMALINVPKKFVCGCCGNTYELSTDFFPGKYVETLLDYECPKGNHHCGKCRDYYRPNGFPCMMGWQCKSDDVGVNFYGSCLTCR